MSPADSSDALPASIAAGLLCNAAHSVMCAVAVSVCDGVRYSMFQRLYSTSRHSVYRLTSCGVVVMANPCERVTSVK